MIDIPTLRTARLTLRPWRESDAEAVYAYASEPETTRFMIFDTHTSIEAARQFVESAPTSDHHGYAVTIGDDDIPMGGCGIRPRLDQRKGEIGYILHKEIWGQGFATELARELVRYGFEDLKLGRIYARTDERNVGSIRVLEKAGMIYEGILREDMVLRGEACNHLMFSVLRREWDLLKAARASREIETPIGTLYAEAAPEGLTRLDFHPGAVATSDNDDACRQHLDSIEAELARYFAGDLERFTTPVALGGTDFQQTVWRELCEIPSGTTVTYTELASRIGNPGAIRAVAAANGANLLSVIVPCHRVIAADGALQGYRGGVEKKRFLIDLERGQSGLFA
jgi:O-6-methylguanine DNA methyltransferase